MNKGFASNARKFYPTKCHRKVALQLLKEEFPELPESTFDPKWHKCFCHQCFKESERVFPRGNPPRKYCLPVGWMRVGLRILPAFADKCTKLCMKTETKTKYRIRKFYNSYFVCISE